MISKILAAFEVIKELIKLIKLLNQWIKDNKKKSDDADALEREKAAEALKNAQTEEEFNNASDNLHKHSN